MENAVANGTKAARVFYTMDPGFAPGIYHVYLDPSGTLFVSGDTGEAIPVDISDAGTVTYTPEPTGLTLAGAACALALRRRRACPGFRRQPIRGSASLVILAWLRPRLARAWRPPAFPAPA